MKNNDKIRRFIKNYRLVRRDTRSGWRRRAFNEFEKMCEKTNLEKQLEKINGNIDLDIERVKKMNIENKLIKCQ